MSDDAPEGPTGVLALRERLRKIAAPAFAPEFEPLERPSGFLVAGHLPEPRRALTLATVETARWKLEWVPLVLDREVPRAAEISAVLTTVHWRLHRFFARFSESVPAEGLGGVERLRTQVGFEMLPRTGQLVRLGVVQSSGSEVFDAAVLETFLQAFPVELPDPGEEVPERLFVTWSVHGYAPYACSTYFAAVYVADDHEPTGSGFVGN
jgi:hypothetical protein